MFRRIIIFALLSIHAALLARAAVTHSPTWDEIAHLPAGISHWQFGRFELYRVNPPLVRIVAAAPVVLSRPVLDWSAFVDGPSARIEFGIGAIFLRANGERAFWYYTLARWACIPFSLLGAWLCYLWARDLYGQNAGMLAVVLWCFEPNILAHGQLITPDVGATALGVAAGYVFWRWLREPTWRRTFCAGLVLGLAELTKFTWIVLFGLWPLLWLAWRLTEKRGRGAGARGEKARSEESGVRSAPGGPAEAGTPTDAGETPASPWRREAAQLAVVFLLALYVINLGYGFEGSFQRLGDYQFVSQPLGGPTETARQVGEASNRFAGTWLAGVPVPVPKNYLLGIDVQKRDFERKMPSYLRGEWRRSGWWYYYLYALGIKTPLGTWALVFVAGFVSIQGATRFGRAKLLPSRRGVLSSQYSVFSREGEATTDAGGPPALQGVGHNAQAGGTPKQLAKAGTLTRPAEAGTPTSWRDELVLLAPAVVVLVLVSSQTGFNHHLRYVLPVFPFVFIWTSKVARAVEFKRWVVVSLAAAALAWSVASSLYYYPHSLSYFNELVGGPTGGHYHLVNSNIDWGQDLFYLKDWLDEHPEARPLTFGYDMPLVDPKLAGIQSTGRPPANWPEPGWHAISVNQIHATGGPYEYFLKFQPVGMAGYSIYIYHITPEEATRVRKELGLPELTKERSS